MQAAALKCIWLWSGCAACALERCSKCQGAYVGSSTSCQQAGRQWIGTMERNSIGCKGSHLALDCAEGVWSCCDCRWLLRKGCCGLLDVSLLLGRLLRGEPPLATLCHSCRAGTRRLLCFGVATVRHENISKWRRGENALWQLCMFRCSACLHRVCRGVSQAWQYPFVSWWSPQEPFPCAASSSPSVCSAGNWDPMAASAAQPPSVLADLAWGVSGG